MAPMYPVPRSVTPTLTPETSHSPTHPPPSLLPTFLLLCGVHILSPKGRYGWNILFGMSSWGKGAERAEYGGRVRAGLGDNGVPREEGSGPEKN